jgi:hypothetical protein
MIECGDFCFKVKLSKSTLQVSFRLASVRLRSMSAPNPACARLVGVCAFSSSLRSLRLVPSKRRYLVPPRAASASCWAVDG